MNKIITKSINVFNLCVPCACHCKYCLLSYEYKLEGIDYNRGLNYAKKFKQWLDNNHPNVNFMYYFGYSMETPNLLNSISDLKSVNSVCSYFLQMNGLKFRNKEQLIVYLQELKNNGIKKIDLTFYGLKESHDDFAGRKGDFDYLMLILECASGIDLDIETGIAVNKSNLLEVDCLVKTIEKYTKDIFLFVPHCGGKGVLIENQKITIEDYNKFSNNVKKYFNRSAFKTQSEWLDFDVCDEKERIISLSLLPTNIEELENSSFEKTYSKLEKLDEDFYKVIPSFKSLLNMYCDKADNRLYSKKDLYAILRKKFIKENKICIKDIDERYSYSLRV